MGKDLDGWGSGYCLSRERKEDTIFQVGNGGVKL